MKSNYCLSLWVKLFHNTQRTPTSSVVLFAWTFLWLGHEHKRKPGGKSLPDWIKHQLSGGSGGGGEGLINFTLILPWLCPLLHTQIYTAFSSIKTKYTNTPEELQEMLHPLLVLLMFHPSSCFWWSGISYYLSCLIQSLMAFEFSCFLFKLSLRSEVIWSLPSLYLQHKHGIVLISNATSLC